MFFISITEINRLKKETNRLLSKGMPNIYLKVSTAKKNWRSKFDFLGLKNLSLCQFWGAPTHKDITEF